MKLRVKIQVTAGYLMMYEPLELKERKGLPNGYHRISLRIEEKTLDHFLEEENDR
jgi:hypothetical protein